MTVPIDLDHQTLGQRVDDADAHTVQTAGDLVALAAELAAGVEHGQHHLGRTLALVRAGRIRVDGDAASTVFHPTATVGLEHDVDPIAVPRHRLVDGVVDHLPDEVVQPGQAGRTDVHAGPLADRVEALEDLDVLGAVVAAAAARGGLLGGRVSRRGGVRTVIERHVVFRSSGCDQDRGRGASSPTSKWRRRPPRPEGRWGWIVASFGSAPCLTRGFVRSLAPDERLSDGFSAYQVGVTPGWHPVHSSDHPDRRLEPPTRAPRPRRCCCSRARRSSARNRTWVAHAGSSTSTNSTPRSSRIGRTWRATAGPTASSQRPNTPPTSARPAPGRNERTTRSSDAVKRDRIGSPRRSSLIVAPSSRRYRDRTGVGSGRCGHGATDDAQDAIGGRGRRHGPRGRDHDLARRQMIAATPPPDRDRARTTRRPAPAPARTRCDRRPGRGPPTATPAPACAVRPATRGCGPGAR